MKLCSQWLHLKSCSEIVGSEGNNSAVDGLVKSLLTGLAHIVAAVRQEVHELEVQGVEVQEVEVPPGAGGPGEGGQEAEGSEAGGPGAKASGIGAGGGLRGVLRCPRVLE